MCYYSLTAVGCKVYSSNAILYNVFSKVYLDHLFHRNGLFLELKSCLSYTCVKATKARVRMRNVGSMISSPKLTRKSGCHSRCSQDLGPTPCVPFIWRCLCLPSSLWLWLPGFHHRSCFLTLDPIVLM